MSFLRKVATVVATAGLLAWIFGSAFAPVANAASLKVKPIKSQLVTNVYEWSNYWWGSTTEPTGTQDDPWIIYAPESNDGDPVATADLDQIVETYVEGSYFEDINGDDLYDSDDVVVKATTTNGLLVSLEDDYTDSCSENEYDYSTSSDTVDSSDGFLLCLAAADDLDSYTSKVSVTVNGTSVGEFYVKVVGPGQSLALTSRTGTWIAMDNTSISSGARIAYLDKSGVNLWTSLWNYDDASWGDDEDFEYLILGFWKDGYDASGDAWLYFAVDNIATGSEFDDNLDNKVDNDSDDMDIGDFSTRTVELNANFCDSTMDEVGDSHTVYAVMDSGNGENSSADSKSNGLVFKCSGSGEYDAYITGMTFAADRVEAGETVALDIQIKDEAGNPMGAGSAEDLDFGFVDWKDCDVYFYENGECTAIQFSPVHEDLAYNTYDGSGYFNKLGTHIEYEDTSDLNTSCEAAGYEDGSTPEDGDDLVDYMTGNGLDYVGDGIVRLCWTASNLPGDLGVNTARLNLVHAYTDDLALVIGNSAVTFKDSVLVVAPGTLDSSVVGLGSTLTVSGKKISASGPVGAKITFVVQNSAMNVKTYVRLVGANGKATLTFTKAGKYKVYAMYGDSITALKTIRVR